MKKKATVCVTALILVYYLFVSGLMFEVTNETEVGMVDTPYAIAFSNERLGFVGLFNEDDVACAKWAVQNSDLRICCDYLGMSLIIEFAGYTRGHYDVDTTSEHLLLLHTWNTQHKKLIFGWHEAMREYEPLPDLDDAKEVFRSGDAHVYWRAQGARMEREW